MPLPSTVAVADPGGCRFDPTLAGHTAVPGLPFGFARWCLHSTLDTTGGWAHVPLTAFHRCLPHYRTFLQQLRFTLLVSHAFGFYTLVSFTLWTCHYHLLLPSTLLTYT